MSFTYRDNKIVTFLSRSRSDSGTRPVQAPLKILDTLLRGYDRRSTPTNGLGEKKQQNTYTFILPPYMVFMKTPHPLNLILVFGKPEIDLKI